eukprot:TRINITY_DN8253_c0_g1_i1.p1 TRINITY_DN8253_c0_g1~~TRINITY_DN8253_c0_g1_i1.p1  ORF type:complete len:558 (-),score=93.43 TRINITY_DN8253_c0_g1_i1:55-1728(-)
MSATSSDEDDSYYRLSEEYVKTLKMEVKLLKKLKNLEKQREQISEEAEEEIDISEKKHSNEKKDEDRRHRSRDEHRDRRRKERDRDRRRDHDSRKHRHHHSSRKHGERRHHSRSSRSSRSRRESPTTLLELLTTTSCKKLASRQVSIKNTATLERAIHMMYSFQLMALPVEKDERIIDQMVDVFAIVSFLIEKSKENFKKAGHALHHSIVQDVLDSGSKKLRWNERTLSLSDSLLKMTQQLDKTHQQIALKNSDERGQVVKQDALVWFLKKNASRLKGLLKQARIDDLRWTTQNAVIASENDTVIEIMEKMVETNSPLIAIVDSENSLITTFSAASLGGLKEEYADLLGSPFKKYLVETKLPEIPPTKCTSSTSLSYIIDLMTEEHAENGVWIVDNKSNKPLEILHCTDLIEFLILREKKLQEKASSRGYKRSRSASLSSDSLSESDGEPEEKEEDINSLSKSGWLWKRSPAFHKKWQRRWFVLNGTSLRYYKEQDTNKVQASGSLVLGSADLLIEELRTESNAFAIIMLSRIYTLKAESVAERDEWLELLRRFSKA